MNVKILAVIPARGGSKGIPRKNLRPLAGRPLLAYSIAACQSSSYALDVVVSTDDEEIAAFASQLGAKVSLRPRELASDSTPLDPVIYHIVKEREEAGELYDLVLTVQPTSPLVRAETIDHAIRRMMESPDIETLISAREDRHLTWRQESGEFVPNYRARVNRQMIEPVYRETGGVLLCRRQILNQGTRIGKKVSLLMVSDQEAIDIDSFEDMKLCEFHLQRKRVVLTMVGNSEVGMGHVYNMLSLAGDLTDHDIIFMIPKGQALARVAVASRNFPYLEQKTDDIVAEIAVLKPDVVVNDLLNTELPYMEALKGAAKIVVNFEDLGPGAQKADLVFNAIYPEGETLSNHFYGAKYVLLRDEFMLPADYSVREEAQSVLLTFGGADPSDLTMKTLKAIYDRCRNLGITIRVVTGLGYRKSAELMTAFPGIHLFRDVKFMSEHMRQADIAFTSAGRTTFEVAAIGVPTIVMSQNKKETTHFFASAEFGFLNLGMGSERSEAEILLAFEELLSNAGRRCDMSRAMQSHSLRDGRRNVGNLLRQRMEKL